jgi:integrase
VLRAPHAPPDPAAIRAFLATLEVDLATVLRLAAASGLRRGELCALRWTDVNVELRALTVARSISTGGGKPKEKDTKTHQVRPLALDAGTIAMLVKHRAAETEKAEFAGVEFDPAGFVFTTEPGRHWNPDALGARYSRAAKAFGLKARLHDWRHWSATYALDAGIPVRQVATRLGHASAAMTLDVYGHAIAPADRAAADALGALLDGTETTTM